MWKRVKGWKEKLLLVAEKEVLIKSVVQAIPIYALSCFWMPKKVFDRWNSIISSFWWNNDNEGRYIAWFGKMTTQRLKEEGGLGLKNFNLNSQSKIFPIDELVRSTNGKESILGLEKHLCRNSTLEKMVGCWRRGSRAVHFDSKSWEFLNQSCVHSTAYRGE
ncbi:hypothetical protein QQ045_032187 [Rhodiola kirilowii]